MSWGNQVCFSPKGVKRQLSLEGGRWEVMPLPRVWAAATRRQQTCWGKRRRASFACFIPISKSVFDHDPASAVTHRHGGGGVSVARLSGLTTVSQGVWAGMAEHRVGSVVGAFPWRDVYVLGSRGELNSEVFALFFPGLFWLSESIVDLWLQIFPPGGGRGEYSLGSGVWLRKRQFALCISRRRHLTSIPTWKTPLFLKHTRMWKELVKVIYCKNPFSADVNRT